MSTLSQFGGSVPTRAVVNFWSSGGVSTNGIQAAQANGAREVLSGALTANTLATVVSLTGGGQIPFLSAYSKDATTRTVRLVVVVDGVTVFDATSSSVSAANAGLVAAGLATGPSNPIRFNSTCLIRVASSLTETNLVAVGYSLN